ncbi:hypothetical protein Tco_1247043, partial [Tanacetum coccineum]
DKNELEHGWKLSIDLSMDGRIWAILRNNEMLTWPEKTKIGNWALAYSFRWAAVSSLDFANQTRSTNGGNWQDELYQEVLYIKLHLLTKEKRHVKHPTVNGGTDQALSSSGRADVRANRNLQQLLQTKRNLDWETRYKIGDRILSGHNAVENWLREGSHNDAKYDADISAAKNADIGKVPPACIFTAIIPALMIAELFFFDCSFALQLAE